MNQEALNSRAIDPRERWAPYIILVFTAIIYLNSLKGDFILDDYTAIRQNQTIRALYPLTIPLSPPEQTSVAGRPFLNLTFALNYAISGLDVWSYHLFNLLIHAGAALLVYGIIKRALRTFPGRFHVHANEIAMISALIWAVHPLQTESVTYMIQRAESLAGLLISGALYCAIRGSASKKSRLWTISAIILCALGVCAKEVAAMAPLLILVYDYLFLSESLIKALRRRIGLYTGMACSWALLPIASLGARSGSVGFGTAGYDPISYSMTQLGVITHYLRLSFFPYPLVLDYFWKIETNPVAVILPGLLLGGILGFTLSALVKKSPLGFPGAWFFLILAPTSSVLPIHTEVAAERRMYLPLIAVVVSVVLFLFRLMDSIGEKRRFFKEKKSMIITILAFLCVGVLSVMTIRRNMDYHDPERMWKSVIKHQPENCRAYLNLGVFYLERGRKEDAMEQYEKALEIAQDPGDISRLHANLAHLSLDQDRFDRAWEHYEKSIEANPQDEIFLNYFGLALARGGRMAEAESVFRRALEVNPENYAACNYLARILEFLGRNEEAIATYEKALQLKPDWRDGQNSLIRLRHEINNAR